MTLLANIEQMSPEQLDLMQKQIMLRQHALMQQRVEQLEDKAAKLEAVNEINNQKMEIMAHRIDNIDCTNIDGSQRDRLNKMIRLFATQSGMYFNKAYREFVQRYNTAYRTNLELRMTNYSRDHGNKKFSTPEYLELTGRLEDAIRVADKMLNRRQAN